jgi:hypothetical protein
VEAIDVEFEVLRKISADRPISVASQAAEDAGEAD